MLILNVSFNVLKMMRPGAARFFFLETKRTVEIFLPFGGMLFRSIYKKRGEEEDRLFASDWLSDSIPILGYEDTANTGARKVVEAIKEMEDKKEENRDTYRRF